MKIKNKLIMSMILLGMLSPMATAAAPTPQTDEAVYVNLDAYGTQKEMRIVKGVTLNGATKLSDFGNYSEVNNLTSHDEPIKRSDGVDFDLKNTDNPSGPTTGTLRVNRGGGWNDYAKHLRSAYRASTTPDQKMSNIGFRVVRNGDNNSDTSVISDTNRNLQTQTGGNILIAYFSWSGNTENAAQIIQEQTGADIIELNPAEPYSSNYSEVLDQAQKDMNADARPELANHVENMEQYDTILLGYPNWWATIPMPVATFLEEYDFSGKTIIPFCSHGGGGFGQSITDISKLAPNSRIGEGLSIHYSGGTSLENDITTWLNSNGVATN